MSKLVLKQADGGNLDIALDKERITIGRRADNDICLPNLAVSGEHAAIVTILDDSFLEDLRSTNGTLVNGVAITKHFLRDGDVIQIGRNELVYRADSQASRESKIGSGLSRAMARDFEKVELAKPFVHAVGSHSYAPMSDGLAASGNGGATVSTDDESTDPGASARRRASSARAASSAPPQRTSEAFATHGARAPGSVAREAPSGATTAEKVPLADLLPTDSSVHSTEATSADTSALPTRAMLKVMSGALAGRSIPITKAETTIGRAGMQVAAIVAVNDAFRLRFVEGAAPPSLNGRSLTADDVPLNAGDVIEIALTRLEFMHASVDPAAN